MEFHDASPVKVAGTGRNAESNPYTDIIKEIALKTNSKGEPIAKAFTLEHEVHGRDQAVAKVKRQMSQAGADNDPAVTVRVHTEPVKNPVNHKVSESKTQVTFWTIKRQTRPRTASTPQSDAVTTPNADAAGKPSGS